MAEDNNINQFNKSLDKDIADSYKGKNQWTHARNSISNSTTGDLGELGNEPGNLQCISAAHTIIGFIYLFEDQWLVFSTNDINSEVGLFKEFTCEYSVLPGDFSCLNLNRKNLITGQAKKNFDCTWSVYFSDGHRNPDRTLNINNIPYLGNNVTDANGCVTFVPTLPLVLDCNKLRLNRSIKIPCIKAIKGPSGGSLLNGSYYATIAYTVNSQKVTDYFNLSNVVSLFSHDNLAGSLDIYLTGLDDSFDEYELVIISIVNQQTVAKRMGLYSTNQQRVSIDIISNELVSVPLEFLPVHNPLMDSSDSITELDDRLLRIRTRSKFDFNYQPLANQIKTKWVSVEYPADYYRDGGENPTFMGDENYAAFIQWIYDDGDLSSSFHIPGRAPLAGETAINSSVNAIENITGATAQQFEVINTAQNPTLLINIPTGDGGYQIAEGDMGYFETSELYPVNKPTVWGNLCGKNIRHHKFPERGKLNGIPFSRLDNYSDFPNAGSPLQGPVIRVLGIRVFNIKPPVDNTGNLIPNIVGYRILRGTREGNKTIIAKGIINNMFEYDLQDGSGKQGLYQNFPYNDLGADPFISKNSIPTSTNAAGSILNATPNDRVNADHYTFHSPDTNFRKPFLSAKELKLYGVVSGRPILQFKEPALHPKHKLLTNLAFFVASLAGIGYAVLKLNGKRSVKYITPTRGATDQEVIRDNRTETGAVTNAGVVLANTAAGTTTLAGTVAGGPAALAGPIVLTGATTGTTGVNTHSLFENSIGAGTPDSVANAGFATAIALVTTANTAFDVVEGVYDSFGDFVQALAGGVNTLRNTAFDATTVTATASPFVQGGAREYTYEGGDAGAMGTFFKTLGSFALFTNYWGQGTDAALELLLNFSQYHQYALQQVSECFYNSFVSTVPTQYRHHLNNSQYLGSSFQQIDANNKVNNLYRASCVTLNTVASIANPSIVDDSKETLQTIGGGIHANPTEVNTVRTASSYYAALKLRLRNQYGQIGDVKQIPIGCVNQIVISSIPTENIFSSPVIFGGDTYITRYTEKNTMFFFFEWLYNQPNGFEYNYLSRRMMQYPMYWANSVKFDTGDFLQGIVTGLGGAVSNLLGGGNTNPTNFQTLLPSGFRALDRNGLKGIFVVKEGYYYLFCSGVRDFYVESEVNVGYRDWEEPVIKRFYDHKTFNSLTDIFNANPDIIKADNFYKYDYSLSITKSFVNFASWASVQPNYYNPIIAETCYTYHPKRVNYSLPQQFEQIRDSWRIFLANNYRDFRSNLLTLKSTGLTGAIILFESDSPLQIQGVETLTASSGTKVLIGDGSFLSQATQTLTNADRPYQHGACQNLRSIVNTPAGLFYLNQSQGKVIVITQGIMDLAMPDMKWWFAKYLPYAILQSFPNFDILDNAVMGVACQAIYDNENAILYFTKKDYKKRDDITDIVTYSPVDGFLVNGILKIQLGDPAYFEDASWTVSYDVKTKSWISYHDWHPELLMPSKNTFSTTKNNGIWVHNKRCDLYCNYYGIDYPWEVEYLNATGVNVNTIRSIEFFLEVYKYDLNCYDRYLFLEDNFDEAVIYNNEQVSGLLRLIPIPFNDPLAIVNYPLYNLASVDVLFSKVEGKYRLNQFYDVTDDRGEFTVAQRMIWNTAANGYVQTLNPANLNYNKDPFQRKRFRGYVNSVFLRRKVSGDKKFLMIFAHNKLLNSPR